VPHSPNVYTSSATRISPEIISLAKLLVVIVFVELNIVDMETQQSFLYVVHFLMPLSTVLHVALQKQQCIIFSAVSERKAFRNVCTSSAVLKA
jgi:hypothetical protein